MPPKIFCGYFSKRAKFRGIKQTFQHVVLFLRYVCLWTKSPAPDEGFRHGAGPWEATREGKIRGPAGPAPGGACCCGGKNAADIAHKARALGWVALPSRVAQQAAERLAFIRFRQAHDLLHVVHDQGQAVAAGFADRGQHPAINPSLKGQGLGVVAAAQKPVQTRFGKAGSRPKTGASPF